MPRLTGAVFVTSCRHGRRGARGIVAARCCSDHHPHDVELGLAQAIC